MTREKRNKIVFLIAIFGIILILITAVSVKIEKQSEEKTVMELKSTLLSITKTCVKDNKCMNDTVTVEELNSLGYINTNLEEKLKNYSEKSYIKYSLSHKHISEPTRLMSI